MAQITFIVAMTNRQDNVKIAATSGDIVLNRTIAKSEVHNKAAVAKWLLSQVNLSTEQDKARQGIYAIDYHIEQVDDDDGGFVDTPIVDSVQKSSLSSLLQHDTASVIAKVNAIDNNEAIKDVLKELVEAVSFLSRRH